MNLIVWDRERGEIATDPTGVYGQISFERLCDALKSAGEVKPNERIVGITVTDQCGGMIRYRVKPVK